MCFSQYASLLAGVTATEAEEIVGGADMLTFAVST